MRIVMRLVTGLILTMLFAGAASAQDRLIVGTEGAYPPFNNLTAGGELVGFDVDIAKALCARMKA
jgi:polar amino acid transport system substrate-binding protein